MTSPASKPLRAWQRMLSGRRLDLLRPSPEDIEIEDIAHGLARVARWNGQTIGDYAFSVAQHSLLVTDIFAALNPDSNRGALLAALLHDAPEYVVGDLISPFKAAIGLDYKAFERRLLDAVYARFSVGDIASSIHSEIKSADRIAAYFEATRLAGFSMVEADALFGRPAVASALALDFEALIAWPTSVAQTRYLGRFREICARSD